MVDVKVIGYYIFNICPHNRNKLQKKKTTKKWKQNKKYMEIEYCLIGTRQDIVL